MAGPGNISTDPACQSELAPGAVMCIACGYNLVTGEYVSTQMDGGEEAVEAAPKKKKKTT